MCGSDLIQNRGSLWTITVLFSIFFVLISTPWDWGFTFWADSLEAWYVHYIIGTALTIYVMWAFVRALVILTSHEKHHIRGCNGGK